MTQEQRAEQRRIEREKRDEFRERAVKCFDEINAALDRHRIQVSTEGWEVEGTFYADDMDGSLCEDEDTIRKLSNKAAKARHATVTKIEASYRVDASRFPPVPLPKP